MPLLLYDTLVKLKLNNANADCLCELVLVPLYSFHKYRWDPTMCQALSQTKDGKFIFVKSQTEACGHPDLSQLFHSATVAQKQPYVIQK